jgi:hypothetical protein
MSGTTPKDLKAAGYEKVAKSMTAWNKWFEDDHGKRYRLMFVEIEQDVGEPVHLLVDASLHRNETQVSLRYFDAHLEALSTVETFFEDAWTKLGFTYVE